MRADSRVAGDHALIRVGPAPSIPVVPIVPNAPSRFSTATLCSSSVSVNEATLCTARLAGTPAVYDMIRLTVPEGEPSAPRRLFRPPRLTTRPRAGLPPLQVQTFILFRNCSRNCSGRNRSKSCTEISLYVGSFPVAESSKAQRSPSREMPGLTHIPYPTGEDRGRQEGSMSPGLYSTSSPRLMTLALPCWVTIECHPLGIPPPSQSLRRQLYMVPSALANGG